MGEVWFGNNLVQQNITVGEQRIETAVVQAIRDDLVEIRQTNTLTALLLREV